VNEVPYKEAGEIGRATLYWATRADLSMSGMKVVVGVVALTALHSKVEDTVALSQVAMHAGLSTRQTSRILKDLTRREGSPIEYEPGGKGHGVRSTVRLRKGDIITPYRVALAQLKGDNAPPNDVHLKGDTDPPNDVHLKGDTDPPNDVHLEYDSRWTSAKTRVTTPRLAATSPSPSSERSKPPDPDARERAPKQIRSNEDEITRLADLELSDELSDEQFEAHVRLTMIVLDVCARDVEPIEAVKLVAHCLGYLEPDDLEAIILQAEDLPGRPEYPSAILALVQTAAERNHVNIPYLRLRRRRTS
jgi:hypothetical protein